MRKSVLISIRPRWIDLISRGEKTIEVRKTRPKLDPPFKCYIYCTKAQTPVLVALQNLEDSPVVMTCGTGTRRYPVEDSSWARLLNGTVCGEFTCDAIVPIVVLDNGSIQNWNAYSLNDACMSYEKMTDYIGRGKHGFGWHISDLKIYDEPKELCDFERWENYGEDIRPCQNGKHCKHLVYDYSEDCQACAIDFDGTDCLYYKVTRPPQSWCYVEELHDAD